MVYPSVTLAQSRSLMHHLYDTPMSDTLKRSLNANVQLLLAGLHERMVDPSLPFDSAACEAASIALLTGDSKMELYPYAIAVILQALTAHKTAAKALDAFAAATTAPPTLFGRLLVLGWQHVVKQLFDASSRTPASQVLALMHGGDTPPQVGPIACFPCWRLAEGEPTAAHAAALHSEDGSSLEQWLWYAVALNLATMHPDLVLVGLPERRAPSSFGERKQVDSAVAATRMQTLATLFSAHRCFIAVPTQHRNPGCEFFAFESGVLRLYEAKQVDDPAKALRSVKGKIADVLKALEDMAEEAERLGATSDAAVMLAQIQEIEFVYVSATALVLAEPPQQGHGPTGTDTAGSEGYWVGWTAPTHSNFTVEGRARFQRTFTSWTQPRVTVKAVSGEELPKLMGPFAYFVAAAEQGDVSPVARN